MTMHKVANYLYSDNNMLGKGQFGNVYQGWDDETKQQVAIKIVQKNSLISSKHKELFQQEVAVMKKLKNENIVELINFVETTNRCYLILEYCNNGDLEKLLNQKHHLSETESIFHLKEILNGFKCMHELKVMHRDFKASNVFIKDEVFKIGDFGFAKQMSENQMAQTTLGTPYYMAPEILQHAKYNSKTDIWAIGIVFYQMLFGELPYQANSQVQLLERQKENKLDFQKNNIIISESTKNLINQMLIFDYQQRIDWYQLFTHSALNLKEIEEKNDEEYEILSSKQAPFIPLKKNIDLQKNANFYLNNEFVENEEIKLEDLLYNFKSEKNSNQEEEKKNNNSIETCTTLNQSETEELEKKLQEQQKMITETNQLHQKYSHEKKLLNQIGQIIEIVYSQEQHNPLIILILWTIYFEKLEQFRESLINKQNIYKSAYLNEYFESKNGKELTNIIENEYLNKKFIYQSLTEEFHQINKKLYSNYELQKEAITSYIFEQFENIDILQKSKEIENKIIKKYQLIYYLQDVLMIEKIYQFNVIDPITKRETQFDFEKYNQKVLSSRFNDISLQTQDRLAKLFG